MDLARFELSPVQITESVLIAGNILFMIDLTLNFRNCCCRHHNHHSNSGRSDSCSQAAEALRLQGLARNLQLSSSFQLKLILLLIFHFQRFFFKFQIFYPKNSKFSKLKIFLFQ